MPRLITDGFKINRPQYAARPRVLRPQPQTGRNALDARGVAAVVVGAAIEDALPNVLQAGREILERGLAVVGSLDSLRLGIIYGGRFEKLQFCKLGWLVLKRGRSLARVR